MPILNRKKYLYPLNWQDIRTAVIERAENKCEFCGLANGIWGYRNAQGIFQPTPKPNVLCLPPPLLTPSESVFKVRIFKIVLSVAHLNHDPRDCRLDNLRLLCQQCHLRYDSEYHAKTRQQTRVIYLQTSGQTFLKFKST